MPKVERSALVPYSDQQMFDLVNDVASYPEFVPGCAAARIIHQSADEIVAELAISKAGMRHTFATKNQLQAPHAIQMELAQGPFKSLSGGWEFKPLAENACKVTLKLDFEFSSKLLHFAFSKVFNEVTSRMVDSFAQRARQVYGSTS
ncbi:type II toxin-antitoxin system RatA family toxin [Aliidiomarina celeris]|uniref:type II toxin-antitoxin system RatA family toxin n=1 Tax=Aliidiomarina celeris TaxID=2249428 RepID=UPI000DE85049|nr:type II toxin-antitoxin system RatA family toxin [Aliidiomarina celeris]